MNKVRVALLVIALGVATARLKKRTAIPEAAPRAVISSVADERAVIAPPAAAKPRLKPKTPRSEKRFDPLWRVLSALEVLPKSAAPIEIRKEDSDADVPDDESEEETGVAKAASAPGALPGAR